MEIVDGGGSGRSALVNDEGQLLTASISSSIEHHINHKHGDAYTVIFSQAPTANDDCILYLKNDADTDMVVEGFYLATSAACEIYVQKNADGTRNAATALTPQNMNFGSGKTANATVEKGADLDGGAATLAGGAEVARGVFYTAISTTYFNFEQDVIIPKNKTLTLWCSTAGVIISAQLPFNYHSAELG